MLVFVQWQLTHLFYCAFIGSNHVDSHNDEKNKEGEEGDAWQNPYILDV